MSQTTTVEDAEYWLALARVPGIGAVKFAQLIKSFQSPKAVFMASRQEWQAFGLKEEMIKHLLNPEWAPIDRDMQWLTQPNNYLLTLQHPAYPVHLRQIHAPPPMLFVHGDYRLLSSPQIAIVGTRNPSVQGIRCAEEFARDLVQAGLIVTSGLAEGIDAAAHWGALSTGKTIAVVGTGLDRVYPAKNLQLAHQIAEQGALVSEFPLGTRPKTSHFPQRNRIISGMSLGTLVVEASTRSGALITARQTAEQGREVFAIPGSIHNPLARGCHALIKEGAKLVENAQDIFEELLIYLPLTLTSTYPEQSDVNNNQQSASSSTVSPNSFNSFEDQELDAQYLHLLEKMGTHPASIDDLVELSGLMAEEIASMLLILELRGLVVSQSGGLYARLS